MDSSGRLLVVDDDPGVRAMLVEYLGGHRYDVRTADSGAAMRAEIERDLPDLILLDIRMPGINGYEVASAIRRQPGLEQTPIVAVTASAMVGDRERIAAAGFDGYIQKPIDPETFVGQIERFLPERFARRHATAGEQ